MVTGAPPEPESAAATAEALARRLAALPEPAMREAVLAEALAGGAPAALCPMLAAVVTRGRAGGPPFDLALLALGGVLASATALPYERRAALYAAARDGGLYDLADLFLSAEAAAEVASPAPLQVDGRTLTLGERKSLARGARRDVLDRLLRDPAAPVIRILLGNPRLIERDVVAIAARRPQLPEIQLEIARSRRWIARYAVKLALVLNPSTPTDLSLRLLQVADDAAVGEPVRAAARRRLAGE